MATTPAVPPGFSIHACVADFEVVPHATYPLALQHVFVHAVHPECGCVGSLEALRINREPRKGEFLTIPEGGSQPLPELVATLFDKAGNLKREVIEREQQEGTGIWGPEFNQGLLLCLLSIEVFKVRVVS